MWPFNGSKYQEPRTAWHCNHQLHAYKYLKKSWQSCESYETLAPLITTTPADLLILRSCCQRRRWTRSESGGIEMLNIGQVTWSTVCIVKYNLPCHDVLLTKALDRSFEANRLKLLQKAPRCYETANTSNGTGTHCLSSCVRLVFLCCRIALRIRWWSTTSEKER